MAGIAIPLHDKAEVIVMLQEWSCCCCSTQWPLLSSYWYFTSAIHYEKTSSSSKQEREMAGIAIPLHDEAGVIIMQEWSCCCFSTPWPLLSLYWIFISNEHYVKTSTRSNQEREMAGIAIPLHDKAEVIVMLQEWSCCCCSTQWPLLSSYWYFTSAIHYEKTSSSSKQEREMAEIAIPLHDEAEVIVIQEWSCCCFSTPWPLLSSYWYFTIAIHYVKTSTTSNQEREMAKVQPQTKRERLLR